ncbi:MAG: thiol:disulfide interchange protein DsbA/DsbL [Gammaproteobacteria bacterium]
MFRQWLPGLILALLFTSQVSAQQAFKENVDYQRIDPVVKTSDPEKIVVTEMFWYGCPHCFRFEPYVEHWIKTIPEGVVFEQVPSVLNPRWTEHARAFYAFKMMGATAQVHKAFFDAIHIKRQRLTSLDTIARFVAEQGLDEDKFREYYFSFPVDTQIRKNKQTERRYGHSGVPAVIVNGKYLISASMAGSFDRMLKIMDFLVAGELNQ